MGYKVYAVAVVLIVVFCAGALVLDSGDDGGGTTIIGRVNTDGSGIFVDPGINVDDFVSYSATEPTSGYYLGDEGNYVVLNRDAWDGKVFGVPSISSIQYVQLSQIAAAMDLNFQLYVESEGAHSGTLYYVSNVSTYDSYTSTKNTLPEMIGAIVWEPQLSIAKADGMQVLVTTNDLFPGHTCCIIGAKNSYLNSHEDETVRFLAAYSQAVDRMNAAIEAGSGDDYDLLIQVAMDNVSYSGSDAQKLQAILSSFENVVYTYADDPNSSDPLSGLKNDIADLAVQLYDAGQISNSYADLGFASPQALAEKFVDSSYMVSALHFQERESYSHATIRVGVISGDIHQLAIHFGIALGLFEDYGLTISLTSEAGGPGVYNLLNTGEVDLGFLGAPPMTINGMNNRDIVA